MANIRTFRDFGDSGPAYQPQRNFAPGPSQSSFASDHVRLISRPYSNYDANPQQGISMMMGDPDPSGLQPELMDRILPRRKLRSFVTILSIVQMIIFITTLIVGGVKFNGAFVKGNEMAGPGAETLDYMGGKVTWKIIDGEVWRLITPIFLHAGIIHITSNLFFQLRLGYTLEERWGWARFALVYLLTGIGASFWSAVLKTDAVSVGASGALFGITGADITYIIYNWSQIPHVKQEACFLGFLTVINLLIGLGSSIDNWAHFGGLMTGLFVGGWLPPVLVQRPTERIIRGAFLLGYIGLTILFACILWVNKPGQ